MSTPPAPPDPAVDQLVDAIDAYALQLAAAIGLDLDEQIRARSPAAAGRLVAELRADDDDLSREAATTVLNLHPGDDDPAWWATPLGAIVARHTATGENLTHAQAAAVLGVTRGTIGQLVHRGTLDRHPDGGVLRSSVLQRLERMRPVADRTRERSAPDTGRPPGGDPPGTGEAGRRQAVDRALT